MKYLVVYVFEQGFGNAECKFEHNPPTILDIRKIEEEIQSANQWATTPKVINFLPLSD